jgi:hypothetical protein
MATRAKPVPKPDSPTAKSAAQKPPPYMESAPRLLCVKTCQSLSGKSDLTYHLGELKSEIYLRLFRNSGAGVFSKDWIPFNTISQGVPLTPFSTKAIAALIKSKSFNTPGFLMAILKEEALIRAEKRLWQWAGEQDFLARIQKLIDKKKAPLDS